MCELNAYLSEDGKEDLFLENVDTIRIEAGRVYLRNLFGEEKTFEGQIKELSLRTKKILLRRND